MLAEVRTWFQPWYNKFGVIVLSAAIGLCAYEWVNWSCLSASDWGTWVGAFGTVATLIGTICIATSETRRQNKQAIDRAYVAAASLESRLESFESELEKALNYLEGEGGLHGSYNYIHLASELEQADSWTDEEILPLIALPGHCSVRMVVIRRQVAALVSTMRKMETNKRRNWSTESMEDQQKALIADVAKCHVSVTFVLDAFSKFAVKMATR